MSRIFTYALSACLIASSAFGQVSSLEIVSVDNSLGGADLTGKVTNDVVIDFTGQYTGAQAWIQLTAGSIYQHAAGGAVAPSAALLPVLPALGFDTFLAQGSPTADGPSGNPAPGGGAVDLGAPAAATFTAQMINQAWNPAGGQANTTDLSDFLLGRFTLSNDAVGTAKFLASAGGQRMTWDLVVENGVIGEGGGGENTPPVATDPTPIANHLAGAAIDLVFAATDAETPVGELVWSNLVFAGAPGNGGSGDPGPNAPTLGANGAFHWDTLGAARGIYTATATVSDTGTPALSDTATLTINITAVPEPSTLALIGLSVVGLVGLVRRRS